MRAIQGFEAQLVEQQLQWLSYFPTKVALTANCTLLLLEVRYFTFSVGGIFLKI